ncbi:GntR family transcriptional regulator [Clostridium estertheticum]|uniref:GntR family transcriptional regulator n=2 Tax=Clostridium estertheticum TaxID=238834 RepID=A0A1J0GP47_9CLOT|nr:GntR family transcriptional regulator [Clostridium estertheticum]APC42688.1 GntR family transcriptional regulator [Clostridium estertheticum subsp. estertheticum]MBU3184268.1 GntR family transcriptional regulator [Clostridium estertheticum]MBW9153953.1 GntR family transcriptional regulator [Clostridium estertheticum]MBZ9617308.1 GntR family transcriptional regulator [Clostridium estertheticum subsp. laramiense]MCB2308456.1 GntR family transcriptional regulator [Clostridium estertheticum]
MTIIISNLSNDPIYLQIIDQIKGLIFSGEIKEGDALPSMRNLAKDLQVSVITTKRAYEELEKEGFIVSLTGKGSFVSGQNKDLLRTKKMKILEEKLKEVLKESKILNLSMEEIIDIMKLLKEDVK